MSARISTTTEDPAIPSDCSPALSLVLATPEEIVVQARKNAVAWKGALTLEAYLRREVHLGQQALTRESGITYWVLVSTAVDPSVRKVLAGCETLRKHALVARNGKVQDVVCHGIGSVFVPPEYRGRRYAQRMMKELQNKLRTYQSETLPCLFSVLYSDIGKKFYTQFGWQPFPSTHVHLQPDQNPPELPNAAGIEISYISTQDLHQLCTRDEALIRQKLSSTKGNTAIALIPDEDTIQWHHARETFVSNELFGRSPSIKGAVATVNGHRVWAIWTRTWYNPITTETEGNTMHILRVCVEDDVLDADESDRSTSHEIGIAAVLRVAQKEAFEWKMHEVEVWNPHPRTMKAMLMLDPKAKAVDREEESIASLRWYGEAGEEVVWMENEKYGWC